MKKILKIVALVFFAAFFIAQFVRPDRSNPTVVQAETLESSMQIPENVESILTRSCNECHTNNTVYPWYSNITPFNWFLDEHINDGRRHLNFSVWNTYETRRKRRKLEEICEQATGKEMPLPSYLWIHRAAKLSDRDIEILCHWTETEKTRLEKTQ
jgi:hypothetical protein